MRYLTIFYINNEYKRYISNIDSFNKLHLYSHSLTIYFPVLKCIYIFMYIILILIILILILIIKITILIMIIILITIIIIIITIIIIIVIIPLSIYLSYI